MDNNLANINVLSANAEVVFTTIENQQYHDQDFSSSTISSSMIIATEFVDTSFYNASFMGTRLINSMFRSSNMNNADIISIVSSDCTFVKVCFDKASITDSSFTNCKFVQCSFRNISMTSNSFSGCTFDGFDVQDSTITLNIFDHCTMKEALLGASFFYQILQDVIWEKSSLDVYLIGYNFGFSIAQMNHCNISVEAIEDLKKKYLESGMLLNAAVVAINSSTSVYDLAIVACSSTIVEMVKRRIIIKPDELRFIRQLIQNLNIKERVAPITILRCWNQLALIQHSIDEYGIKNVFEAINDLRNALYFLYQEFAEKLQEKLLSIPVYKLPVKICLTFEVKPKIDLASLLNQVYDHNANGFKEAKIVKTQPGSFIAWLESIDAVLPYLQIIVSLLGISIPIAIAQKNRKIDKEEKKQEEAKKKHEDNITINDTQIFIIPVPVGLPLSKDNEMIVRDVLSVLIQNQLLNTSDFSGLNSVNLRRIEVVNV